MKEHKEPIEYTPERGKIKAPSGDLINSFEMEKAIANQMIETAPKRPDELEDLVERTQVARKSLLEAIRSVGEAIEMFTPKSNEYIRELRSFSTCGVLELKNLLRAFEDIRKFFLSEQHEPEIKRLSEFVSMCERLKALKDSGFLDSVADTILKLHE